MGCGGVNSAAKGGCVNVEWMNSWTKMDVQKGEKIVQVDI